jgi:hypothetical protein
LLTVIANDDNHRFEAQTATVGALKQRASEYPMFDLRSDEDMITDPQGTLKRLFDFLEVPHTDEFIATCASIVYVKPHKSRSVSCHSCLYRGGGVCLIQMWLEQARVRVEGRGEEANRGPHREDRVVQWLLLRQLNPFPLHPNANIVAL